MERIEDTHEALARHGEGVADTGGGQGLDHRPPAGHAGGGRIGFDATTKLPGDARDGLPVRAYPPPQTLSTEMVKHVKERWDQYGLAR